MYSNDIYDFILIGTVKFQPGLKEYKEVIADARYYYGDCGFKKINNDNTWYYC
jgi:hypothetical protein